MNTIEYEITGKTSKALVTLVNSGGGIEQYNSPVPNKYTCANFMANVASVSAQNQSWRGNIAVTIYYNGKPVQSSRSDGGYTIATAACKIHE